MEYICMVLVINTIQTWALLKYHIFSHPSLFCRGFRYIAAVGSIPVQHVTCEHSGMIWICSGLTWLHQFCTNIVVGLVSCDMVYRFEPWICYNHYYVYSAKWWKLGITVWYYDSIQAAFISDWHICVCKVLLHQIRHNLNIVLYFRDSNSSMPSNWIWIKFASKILLVRFFKQWGERFRMVSHSIVLMWNWCCQIGHTHPASIVYNIRDDDIYWCVCILCSTVFWSMGDDLWPEV